MFKDSTLVIPWDFSDRSREASLFGQTLTSADRIHYVCVLDQPEVYSLEWASQSPEEAAESCAEHFWKVSGVSPDSGCHFHIRFGDPATEVVALAQELNASLILLPTHGRTGVQRLVMGSVAEQVLRRAHGPVMLLPNAWYEKRRGGSPDPLQISDPN